ncbi:MAG: hypothetical protein AABW51_04225 [Nanoarchaeota archaeon]
MINKKIIFVFAFLTLMLISSISAIGITPGRTTLDFEPSAHHEVSFSIINSNHKDMSVVFVVRGNLSNYITLKQTYAEFSSADESKSFTYLVDLPDKFDKPGLQDGEIVALELPKNIKQQGTFVGATVGVASQLYVHVPYPGKYVDAEVNVIQDTGKNLFVIPIINRGKLDIVNVKAIIDIYTSLNEKVATIETDSNSLNSLERKELVAQWGGNVNPGKYLAVVSVIYDGQTTNVEKDFAIGEKLIDLLNISVKDFRLGEIAKFNALVENKWSDQLKDVYLNILVYNNQSEVMADFKSPNYDINGLSKEEMIAYWDTGGVHQGTYDGKLILKYGESSVEKNIQLKISSDSLEIIGVTGKVIVKGKSSLNVNNLLIILVVGLVIANIVWFVLIKKLLKKRK